MPQLNPSPWFTIMVFTWLIFLYALPAKILAHTYMNEQTGMTLDFPEPEAWFWPWL
uniref:ATP synthase complex subunit 8 n=1 Tax=Pomacanthus imperator TaxID=109711 RepID=A0A0U1YSZ0_POMIM|nr:ATP synthase F0 subunit 8 [Pomacanthus imperator]AJE75232.1 ATP synthase F0 subunit 8 [Pomacanthus imperator]